MPIRRQVREQTGIYRRVSTSGPESDWEQIFREKAQQLDQARRLAEIERIATAMLNGDQPSANDAQDALDSLRFVRHWIDRGDALSAAVEAVQLGVIWERLRVRAFEPLVERGQKAKDGAQASARSRHESLAPRRSQIRTRFAQVHPAEVKNKTAAVRLVAREFGVKPRTVYRALETGPQNTGSSRRDGTNGTVG